MKQLEESAFSIDEAHNILTLQFGTGAGDAVKDAVLSEWCGEVGLTTAVADMTEAQRLDALDLLPAPFPIEKYLDKRDLEHVKRLYSIGGLSYGNLSARKDATRFWMSASRSSSSPAEASETFSASMAIA